MYTTPDFNMPFELTRETVKEAVDTFCHAMRNVHNVFIFSIRRKKKGNYFQIIMRCQSPTGQTLMKCGFNMFKNDNNHWMFFLSYLHNLEKHFTTEPTPASESDIDID